MENLGQYVIFGLQMLDAGLVWTTEALRHRAVMVLSCFITFQVSQAKVEMFHQVCICHHGVENISCLGLDVTLHLKALAIE